MAERTSDHGGAEKSDAASTTDGAKAHVEQDYEALKQDFIKLRGDIAELMQTMVGASKAKGAISVIGCRPKPNAAPSS